MGALSMIRYGAAALAMAGLVLAGCASTQSNSNAGGAGSGTTTGPSLGGPASGSPSAAGSSSSAPADTLSPSQLAAIAATCPSDQNFPQANGPTARTVPTTLQASWVLRCTISNKGGSRLLVAEHSVGDTAPLLRALKAPSAQRMKVVCPMLRVLIPYFALVEPDGTLFVPKVPLNNCGMPQNPVAVALNQLRFTTLSSKPIG
ncbi:MAG TPA: hypothetical protein VFD94_08085 [Jatrophihabitans sp.]|jgi:hypothetical protein|nr:hypothetical protein [Jatrophihabitans sp.]